MSAFANRGWGEGRRALVLVTGVRVAGKDYVLESHAVMQLGLSDSWWLDLAASLPHMLQLADFPTGMKAPH